MQGRNRFLVVPPITLAEHDAQQRELSAAERIAEHTGHPEHSVADEIADFLVRQGHKITSGERCVIADIVGRS